MCVCVCVCVYVCVICVCVMHACVCVCLHVYVCVYTMGMCMYMCVIMFFHALSNFHMLKESLLCNAEFVHQMHISRIVCVCGGGR